jgi:CRISPR type III-B/RAMP module RAMP protein Cmr1
VRKFEILTIGLRNITPTMIGGYRATTFSSSLKIAERFRVQELKGIWRWWFRALAAGALWDAYGYVKKEEVRKKVGTVLGSTEASSKFILQAYAKREGYPKQPALNVILPPRLQILKLTRETDKLYYYDADDLEYALKLLKQPRMELRKDELRVGIGSLLMALIFQGVGALTRRGFGAWEIQVDKDSIGEEYRDKLKDYIQIIKEFNEVESEGDATRIVNRLIQLIHGDFSELMGASREGRKMDGIPPFSLVSNNPRIFRFVIKGTMAPSPMDLLVKVGNATMKATWKGCLHPPMHPKAPDGRLHTWILGLPRGQKRGKHGYIVDPKVFELGRRPSAISIHPLKRLSDKKWICMVYGFLSKDWPKTLYHLSPQFGENRVDTIPVRSQGKHLTFNIPSEYDKFQEAVFNTAFDMVVKCL